MESQTIPTGDEVCNEGYVTGQFFDGVYRIFAGHDCTSKRMILKLSWEIGAYATHVDKLNMESQKIQCYKRNGKEYCIFNVTPNNNRLAIEFVEDFDGDYTVRKKEWKKWKNWRN